MSPISTARNEEIIAYLLFCNRMVREGGIFAANRLVGV